MNNKALISFVALFAFTGAVHAAAGNATAGEQKAQACMACHGPGGKSMVPMFPKLAGQHASYIAKELADFKAGKTRTDATMAPQTAALSEQDMADLGAYYASQAPDIGVADKEKSKLGKKIFEAGNKISGVSACMACHGPTGSGNPTARFPRLGGQHATYTIKALKDFRSHVRSNDPGKMMQTVTAHMTDEEIDAVASYIEGLH